MRSHEEKKRAPEMQVVRRILALQDPTVRLQLLVTEKGAPAKIFADSSTTTIADSEKKLKSIEKRIDAILAAGDGHLQKYPEDRKGMVEDLAYVLIFDRMIDCGGVCVLGKNSRHYSSMHKILRVAYRAQNSV